jgi:hypothetical protein
MTGFDPTNGGAPEWSPPWRVIGVAVLLLSVVGGVI